MIRASVALTRRLWLAIKARRVAWMTAGAVGFGALSVVGAHRYIGERLAIETARLQPRQQMIEVVVAKRDLRRGDVVAAETMAVRALPREFAPGGAVVPARFEALAGSRLLTSMRAGEPLLPSVVANADTAPISSRVKPGIRAMTIAVDEVNSLSGMLQPGDRIDLLLSVRPPPLGGVPQPEITRTVMQRVAVLATGRQSRAGDETAPARPFTSITVEVEPEQAQRLVVAQRSGKLTAVLRHPDDRSAAGEERLDVNALLGLAPMRVAAAPLPVEVIVGGRGQAPAQSDRGAPVTAQLPVGAPGTGASGPPASGPARAAASSSMTPVPEGLAVPGRPEGGMRIPMLDEPWSPPAPATVPLYR